MPEIFNISDVFISYSRRDSDFIHKLDDAFRERDREVWVDWEDIPPTADWWKEIEAGIEAASTFVFVISPDSARSEICYKEIQHAVVHNKRIIPILYRDVDLKSGDYDLHSAIKSHNWIFFRETDDFDESFDRVITALDNDLDYAKEHTRLIVRAREWVDRNRDVDFLLNGVEVQEAEDWLARSVHHSVKPTELQTEYIIASRKHQNRRTRLLLFGVSVALIISIALMIVSIFLAREANTNAELAEANYGTAQANLDVAERRGRQIDIQFTAIFQGVQTAQAESIRADEQARTAVAAQGQAEQEANIAMTARAQAVVNLDLAEERGTQIADQVVVVENERDRAELAEEIALTNVQLASDAEERAQEEANIALTARSEALTNLELAQARGTEVAEQVNVVESERDRAATAEAEAIDNAYTAVAAEEVANANAGTAVAAEERANKEAEVALTARSEAEANLNLAEARGTEVAEQVQTAEAERARADALRVIAEESEQQARAQALAVSAEQLLNTGNADLTILLGIEALAIDPDLLQAQRILNRAAPFSVRLNFEQIGRNLVQQEGLLSEIRQIAIDTHYPPPQINEFDPDSDHIVTTVDGTIVSVWNIDEREEVFRLDGHADFLTDVAYSGTGTFLVSTDESGLTMVWDADTGGRLYNIETAPILELVAHPEEALMLAHTADHALLLWDLEIGETVASLPEVPTPIVEMVFKDHAPEVLIYSGNAEIEDSLTLTTWHYQAETTTTMQVPAYRGISDNGQVAFTGGADSEVMQFWEAQTGNLISSPRQFGVGVESIRQVVFRSDNERAVLYTVRPAPPDVTGNSEGFVGRLAAYDIARGQPSGEFDILDDNWTVYNMVYSPSGRYLITSGLFEGVQTLILWNADNYDEIRRYVGHDDRPLAIGFADDERHFFSWSADGNMRVWDILGNERTEIRRISTFTNDFDNIGFSPDETMLYAAAADGRARGDNRINWRSWSVETGGTDTDDITVGANIRQADYNVNQPQAILSINASEPSTLAGQQRYVAVLVDQNAGGIIARYGGVRDSIETVAFSPDGRLVALAGYSLAFEDSESFNLLDVWQVETDTRVVRLENFREQDLNEALANNEELAWLAGRVRFDTDEAELIPDEHLTLDRSAILTVNNVENSLLLVDRVTEDIILRFDGHSADITAYSFSPDRTRIVSGDTDGNIILWDTSGGEAIDTYQNLGDSIREVVFTQDGDTFASAGAESITLWRIETPDELVAWLSENRNIIEPTCAERAQYGLRPLCGQSGTLPTLTPDADSALTPEPILEPTPTLTPSPQPFPVIVVEAEASLGLRIRPQADLAPFAEVEPGTQVTVIEIADFTDDPWVKILLPNGTEGWVQARFIRVTNE